MARKRSQPGDLEFSDDLVGNQYSRANAPFEHCLGLPQFRTGYSASSTGLYLLESQHWALVGFGVRPQSDRRTAVRQASEEGCHFPDIPFHRVEIDEQGRGIQRIPLQTGRPG
jgi:hypothetical protein